MARLQILELPTTERPDGTDETPYILVIDQVGEETATDIARWPDDIATRTGARHVLCFSETVDIPANETPVDPDGYPLKFRIEPDFETFREQVQDEIRKTQGELTRALNATDWENELADVRQDRDEARNWARHGYEIGQRHCGWTDHGVAPAWLTDGWPPHIDSCEHLKQAAEYDEALTRVRNLPEEPEIMNAQEPDLNSYLHGYGVATRIAKRAACSRQVAEESSDTERSPEE